MILIKIISYPYVQGIDAIEMSAFIGLRYYRGLYKLNTISIQKLFSDKLKGVKEVLKRSNSSQREETCYVEALFYFSEILR